jgi:pimeloyl-ACP methyl ester carboxylesterase
LLGCHSLGALAALKVIDIAPVRHLVLCSASALFAEDIRENVNPAVASRIGHARVQELSEFSAEDAVGAVNSLDIPTTVMFGENEHETNPYLVARCSQLAADIINAEFIEVTGAGHIIGCDPYASELARVVGDIFSDLQ